MKLYILALVHGVAMGFVRDALKTAVLGETASPPWGRALVSVRIPGPVFCMLAPGGG